MLDQTLENSFSCANRHRRSDKGMVSITRNIDDSKQLLEGEDAKEEEKWSFGNSLIFTFSVMTTIDIDFPGYGHIAPETLCGRIFCISYGLIGVPLSFLTIANIGMFISMAVKKVASIFHNVLLLCANLFRGKYHLPVEMSSNKGDMYLSERDVLQEGLGNSRMRKMEEAIALSLTFVCYLTLGACVLAVYEPELDFFKALYFNFVTLTTIGLGDFVPRSFDYLFLTLGYIGIGLALTTMAIELAADLLRKLHYFGRKIDNMASVVIWFGGKRMTVRKLIKNLLDQFNIPEEDMMNFNLNQFLESAMKVEAGEIRTLRKAVLRICDHDALSYSKLRDSNRSDIHFVDDPKSKRTG
ncbi:Ion channel [Dictyocaulus viviparus]|uniref:Ion channel n=1 Tax=Dictyocaulus viviparus TaxID=29172 RepID=A0A0D8XNX2_DICVI|nr:Ion channel [Dictyocaulus viviparus]